MSRERVATRLECRTEDDARRPSGTGRVDAPIVTAASTEVMPMSTRLLFVTLTAAPFALLACASEEGTTGDVQTIIKNNPDSTVTTVSGYDRRWRV